MKRICILKNSILLDFLSSDGFSLKHEYSSQFQKLEKYADTENGIAWRGGAGFHYTIFEDVKEENKLQTA